MIGDWADLTTTDLAAVDPARAVAILPLGTDAMINRGVLDRALPRVAAGHWVRVLPMQAVGDSLEHAAFPGTLTLSAETVMAAWTEMGAGVARAGVRKLILFNSHGGQTGLVDTVAVRLRQHHGLLTVRASTFALGLPDGLVDPVEAAHGLHGGAVETAVMMALHPHLVRYHAVAAFPSAAMPIADTYRVLRAEGPVGLGWAAQDLHPQGPTGDATMATTAMGDAILAHWADRLAALIEDVARLPLDTLRPGPLGMTLSDAGNP